MREGEPARLPHIMPESGKNENEEDLEMRRSNWKTKVLVALAVALGIAAGALVATISREAIGGFATPLALLAGGLVALAAVYVGAGVLGIGGD